MSITYVLLFRFLSTVVSHVEKNYIFALDDKLKIFLVSKFSASAEGKYASVTRLAYFSIRENGSIRSYRRVLPHYLFNLYQLSCVDFLERT